MSEIAQRRRFLHTPAGMMKGLVKYAEQARAGHGAKWHIEGMDERIIPMRPGTLTGVMARPGHGKTSILLYLALKEAEAIRDRGMQDKECVVYVSWEQSSEELASVLVSRPGMTASDIAWGRTNPADLDRRAAQAADYPTWNLYFIGYGAFGGYTNAERMYLDNVLESIESIEEDYGLRPTLVLYDYIQLIPSRVAKDRMTQVQEAPIRIKEVAQRIGAPAVSAIQARRDVDDRNLKIPTMRDAQWASAIEQTVDSLYGLWIPSRDLVVGAPLGKGEDGVPQVTVTQNMMLIRLLKQRGDVGYATFLTDFNPATLSLQELKLRRTDV